MGITTLYYFIAFIIFVGCLSGVHRWANLPWQKKYRIGLVVICVFLFSLIGFVFLVLSKVIYFNGADTISLSMLFFFLFILFTAFFISWYNEKYDKKINIGNVVIVLSLSAFGIIFLYVNKDWRNDKLFLIQNIQLNTVVANITFDSHKPYFKNMLLADGQLLPMPETMNNSLQIGDSIYKGEGEQFYTVVNSKTKLITQYLVTTHTRILGNSK